jgi:hypothetical protein
VIILKGPVVLTWYRGGGVPLQYDFALFARAIAKHSVKKS